MKPQEPAATQRDQAGITLAAQTDGNKTDPTVARTILAQLGGGRFIAMTGANHFLAGRSELQFRIPLCGRQRRNINGIRIELAGDDTYRVQFYYIYRTGLRLNEVSKHEGIYEDNLQQLVTEQTGLALSL